MESYFMFIKNTLDLCIPASILKFIDTFVPSEYNINICKEIEKYPGDFYTDIVCKNSTNSKKIYIPTKYINYDWNTLFSDIHKSSHGQSSYAWVCKCNEIPLRIFIHISKNRKGTLALDKSRRRLKYVGGYRYFMCYKCLNLKCIFKRNNKDEVCTICIEQFTTYGSFQTHYVGAINKITLTII